jgi:hypothetical protein
MLRILSISTLVFLFLQTIGIVAEPAKSDLSSDSSVKRENIEWTNIWIPDLSKNDLPRVLLIGDSICNGYQNHVRELLKGKAYVAMMATSGGLQDPAYQEQVKLLVRNYKFAVIHFNYGLHGFDYNENEYARDLPKLLKIIRDGAPDAKLIWATSTPIREGSPNQEKFADNNKRVLARNKAVSELAAKEKIPIDDLYTLVENHPEYSSGDGYHYNDKGQAAEAKQVADTVRNALDK